MPFPPHARLVWGGTLFSGAEIWSCSLKIGLDGDADTAEIPDLTQTLGEIIRDTWHTASESFTHSQARMEWVKFNEIGPDGKYASDTDSNLWELTTPAEGGTTGGEFGPPQLARVITLRSNRRRGPASRGRFFQPMPSFLLGGDGRDNATRVDTIANQAATLVESLNAAMTNMRVSLVTDAGGGLEQPVTGVGVGRVIDTQRRRRNALDEEPVTIDVDGVPVFGGGG